MSETVHIGLRVDKSEHEKLLKIAAGEKSTITDVIRKMIRQTRVEEVQHTVIGLVISEDKNEFA